MENTSIKIGNVVQLKSDKYSGFNVFYTVEYVDDDDVDILGRDGNGNVTKLSVQKAMLIKLEE